MADINEKLAGYSSNNIEDRRDRPGMTSYRQQRAALSISDAVPRKPEDDVQTYSAPPKPQLKKASDFGLAPGPGEQ